ncbi:MAG TPA: c-type cytochrome biogenesis protein CcmI [Pyrinomonadaceae bacterium]|nr:c-type cytochrome biogenesis protein CcmI [Pyrinomonadaceae bacterium]
MIIFWFICAMMVLLALWFVLPALLQTEPDAKTDDARAANLLVYKDQLREMAADLKSGLLSEAQYEQDKEELERRLLEDVGDGKAKPSSRQLRSRALAYSIAIAIPVAALAFYFAIGNPKAVEPNTVSPPMMRTR